MKHAYGHCKIPAIKIFNNYTWHILFILFGVRGLNKKKNKNTPKQKKNNHLRKIKYKKDEDTAA